MRTKPDRDRRNRRLIPQSCASGDFHLSGGSPIPGQRVCLPLRGGISEARSQLWLSFAFERMAASFSCFTHRGVLPWDMVDNSIGLCIPLRAFFVMRQSRPSFFSRSQAPSNFFCEHLHQISRDLTLHLSLASAPLKRRSAPRDTRAPRAPSIVDSFYPRPWPACVVGSVARAVCHRVLVAAQASRAVLREDAQSGNRRATTPAGPTGSRTAAPWPRSGEQGRRHHGARSD